jgi:hypothetical protein
VQIGHAQRVGVIISRTRGGICRWPAPYNKSVQQSHPHQPCATASCCDVHGLRYLNCCFRCWYARCLYIQLLPLHYMLLLLPSPSIHRRFLTLLRLRPQFVADCFSPCYFIKRDFNWWSADVGAAPAEVQLAMLAVHLIILPLLPHMVQSGPLQWGSSKFWKGGAFLERLMQAYPGLPKTQIYRDVISIIRVFVSYMYFTILDISVSELCLTHPWQKDSKALRIRRVAGW